ncbi:MAG: hypothetical protein IBX55_20540 [Methyloprofundus sp.]|nr:hypothetical protein [Methyloprofundus sp.]
MKIEEPWVKIIKTTGSIGVIALLLTILMRYIFSDEIIKLFGSDKMYYLVIVLIVGFILVLIVAIMKSKVTSSEVHETSGKKVEKKKNKVIYDNGSTHNGDNNF